MSDLALPQPLPNLYHLQVCLLLEEERSYDQMFLRDKVQSGMDSANVKQRLAI